MPMYYRRPGVYLEESLLINPSDVAGTFTVGAFVGVAEKGPINEPVRVESWSGYVTQFGGLNPISQPPLPDPLNVTARLTTVPPSPVPADLTALKAHATYGDGLYADVAPGFAGPAFTAGQYVLLTGGGKAHFTSHTTDGVWESGAFPGGTAAAPLPKILSYLPFSVYSFFQNGGRVCWVIRAAPTTDPDRGVNSSIIVAGTGGGASNTSFELKARSPGLWGNNLKYSLAKQNTGGDLFTLQVLLLNSDNRDEVVETFTSLSITGDVAGSRRLGSVINDPIIGSRYVAVAVVNEAQPIPEPTANPVALAGGADPVIPDPGELQEAADLITKVEGPIALNICGYLNDASKVDTNVYADAWVGATPVQGRFADRQDIITIIDNAPPRELGDSSSSYMGLIANQDRLGANAGDSYSASYGPWIVIPHPSRVGSTISVPPGGAVIGMMARIDSTVGVFRAPAGVIAGLSNAVSVQTRFTDTELGDLNSKNINVIRSVVGSGICVMGGRTRKTYNADRYVSARRTLIYIKETLKRSTQFAVFENNDQRLWSSLRMAAERLLRPLWEAGGLAGSSTADAYYITCDDTINTPQVIQSGEVHMEVGVALEYPAEFVVIRITQFDRGTFAGEVQTQTVV